MTSFVDGPAQGKTLQLGRAPLFLRVVIEPHPAGDEMLIDALDQLEDEWHPDEYVHVYLRIGKPSWAFIDGRDQKTGRRFGRRLEWAPYMYYDRQPAQDILRSTKLWREWVTGEDYAHALEIIKANRKPTEEK